MQTVFDQNITAVVALETDFEYFQKFGSTQKAIDYAADLIGCEWGWSWGVTAGQGSGTCLQGHWQRVPLPPLNSPHGLSPAV